jgi:hypothetical protein
MSSTALNMTVSPLTHGMAVKGYLCVIVAMRKLGCFVVPEDLPRIGCYSRSVRLNESSRLRTWIREHGETFSCDAVIVRWYRVVSRVSCGIRRNGP